MPSRILSLFRNLFRKRAVEREMDDELRSSVELLMQEKTKQGLPPSAARREALIELGGVEQVKEEVRAVRAGRFLEDFARDIRLALRTLAKSPGFTAVAVLTLALGIGANTAIFSVVNGVLLRALPYRQPRRLYAINEVVPQWRSAYPILPVTGGNFLLWQKNARGFESMAALQTTSASLLGMGPTRYLHGAAVTASYFPTLGVRPELGRVFLPEEDQPGRGGEVILTDSLWQQLFDSNPAALDKPVNLGGDLFTIVGVLPASFRYLLGSTAIAHTPEYFVPLTWNQFNSEPSIGTHNYTVIARLRPGVSAAQAVSQINIIEAQIARKDAGGKFGLYAVLTPLKTEIVGQAQKAIWMLVVAATSLLLIVCVNVANLMLVKNAGRAHEIAVRSALGATPRRLASQLFAEGLLMAGAGGLLGLGLADWGLALLVRDTPLGIPRADQIRLDPRALVFTVVISLLAALLFAFLPAMRVACIEPAEALKTAGPAVSGAKSAARWRSGLVVGEIALSGMLGAGASLLVESLARVGEANRWMAVQHVLTASVIPPPGPRMTSSQIAQVSPPALEKFEKAENSARAQFYSLVALKIMNLPGVKSAGFVSDLPLKGFDWGDSIDFKEAPRPADKPALGEYRFVSPGYFQAVGLRLVRGRFLSDSDDGQKVALVSQKAARAYAPGRNPIGMHVQCAMEEGWCDVVGVVADVRDAPDQSSTPTAYFPLWIYSEPSETLVVRTAMDPRAAGAAIRQAVWSVDAQAAIPREETLKNIVETTTAPRRYETSLGALFAMCAIFLAALGLYGVISYSVRQRTQEIGIRMALGARREDVLKLVVGQGFKLTLFGVGIGVAGALGLTRFLSSLLFGVNPNDPLTLIAVSLILTVVALVACYIPARRATKVDPIVALRYE